MFEKIVVPLDGSQLAEGALPLAAWLAGGFNSKLELLSVGSEEFVQAVNKPLRSRYGRFARSGPAAIIEKYLEAASRQVGFPDGRVTTELQFGNPPDVIVDEAEREQGTLIVMTTHGRSGIGRYALGSVATKVIQTSKAPVLLRRAREGEEPQPPVIKGIIVPLDGSELAERALPYAEALASAFRLDLTLLRVTPSWIPISAGMAEFQAGEAVAQLEQEAAHYLEALAARLRKGGVGRVFTKFVRMGDPADEILKLAKAEPECMIALSTHGRSGLKRWVLGSVTDRVANHSAMPVLVVRP